MDPDTGSSNFVVVTPSCGCSYYGSGYTPNINKISTCGSSCANTTSPFYIRSCDSCSSFSCGSCQVTVRYGDGSYANGRIYLDTYYPEPTVAVPVYLGAMDTVSGKFSSFNDDGILGLAFAPLARGIPTFMHSLTQAGYSDSFSACYGSYGLAFCVWNVLFLKMVFPCKR